MHSTGRKAMHPAAVIVDQYRQRRRKKG